MRNTTYSKKPDGTMEVVQDIEITHVVGVATVIDHIIGTSRPATIEETAPLLAQEKATKLEEAKARAITAIKANATASPWGKILYDLAVSQGLIEPE